MKLMGPLSEQAFTLWEFLRVKKRRKALKNLSHEIIAEKFARKFGHSDSRRSKNPNQVDGPPPT
jgi:hypothetical protein